MTRFPPSNTGFSTRFPFTTSGGAPTGRGASWNTYGGVHIDFNHVGE